MSNDRDHAESNDPGLKPDVDKNWPTGIDEGVETARPDDRDDYIIYEPRPDEGEARAPDPSKASNAERYSHHKSSSDRCYRGPMKR